MKRDTAQRFSVVGRLGEELRPINGIPVRDTDNPLKSFERLREFRSRNSIPLFCCGISGLQARRHNRMKHELSGSQMHIDHCVTPKTTHGVLRCFHYTQVSEKTALIAARYGLGFPYRL